jgi:metallo-beta-lactamase family protein
MAELTFYGGAGTVTGSKILLRSNASALLIDCGMFQGLKELRLRNRAPFPFDPKSLSAVLLTHAHLDHCGLLPLLVKAGFSGPIYCTPATADIARVVLDDAARIQEEDADRANRYSYSKHQPALPLFKTGDAERVYPLFETHDYGEWVVINNDFKFSLNNAGHIPGSAWAEVRCEGRKWVFSGDLGRQHPLTQQIRSNCHSADVLILESTYGNRQHAITSPAEALEAEINMALEKGGSVYLPAFAVQRSQDVLYLLGILIAEKRIRDVPIYFDSPMGAEVSRLMLAHRVYGHLREDAFIAIMDAMHIIGRSSESEKIAAENRSKIVVAGSGMLTGGRMLIYLSHALADPNATVLLTGYQSEGTRGRDLWEGKQQIKFYGDYHEVRCRVAMLEGLSGHADRDELSTWTSHIASPPRRIFLNHAESEAARGLRLHLSHMGHQEVEEAVYGQTYTL